jgi:hypothetical protein
VVAHKNIIIRAGKAQSAWDRKAQHSSNFRSSKYAHDSPHAKSKFYSQFKTEDEWKELKWYEGLTFDLQGADAAFCFSDEVLLKVNHVIDQDKSWGGGSAEKRKELLVQYLCEWMYTTLMSRKECVSEAPGFEAIIGYFPKKQMHEAFMTSHQVEQDLSQDIAHQGFESDFVHDFVDEEEFGDRTNDSDSEEIDEEEDDEVDVDGVDDKMHDEYYNEEAEHEIQHDLHCDINQLESNSTKKGKIKRNNFKAEVNAKKRRRGNQSCC